MSHLPTKGEWKRVTAATEQVERGGEELLGKARRRLPVSEGNVGIVAISGGGYFGTYYGDYYRRIDQEAIGQIRVECLNGEWTFSNDSQRAGSKLFHGFFLVVRGKAEGYW